ncbi:hypothetical protein D7X48_01335 [bacterium D16-50]|nr:hypothetical protein D7X48_01335 [bacterium D16-50]
MDFAGKSLVCGLQQNPEVLAGFEFSEDGSRLLKCAAGYAPLSQTYTKIIRQCRVSLGQKAFFSCKKSIDIYV